MQNASSNVIIVNVGNSQTKIGIFNSYDKILVKSVNASNKSSFNTIKHLLEEYRVMEGVICYVPKSAFVKKITSYNRGTKWIPFDILIKKMGYQLPYNQIGMDRVALVLGIHRLYPKVNNFIAISLGTAITYNVVKDNKFIGGAISPGIDVRYKSLKYYTTALPYILPQERVSLSFPASSTISAINTGILMGVVAEISFFVKKMGFSEVFFSGGNFNLIKPFIDFSYNYNEFFELLGIYHAYEQTNEPSKKL